MRRLSSAEQLLQELGVSQPDEIDLEAIASYLGVQIKYRNLVSCEARIAGDMTRAIISVRANASPARRRFSIGHELGHWQHHRGRTLICRPEDIGEEGQGKLQTERVADQYAADLLMPLYLLAPIARTYRTLTWEAVIELADRFTTSITSTAIRIIDTNLFPALLVCHGTSGRRWFVRAKDVPDRWFPRAELDADSYAFDVLYGKRDKHRPVLMDADTWFDRYDANRFQLYEQSIQVTPGEVLTLLVPKDGDMLEDTENTRSWRRR